MPTKTIQLIIRVSPKQWEAIRAAVYMARTSRAQWLREAIEKKLKEEAK
jgi:hypothetical protein